MSKCSGANNHAIYARGLCPFRRPLLQSRKHVFLLLLLSFVLWFMGLLLLFAFALDVFVFDVVAFALCFEIV